MLLRINISLQYVMSEISKARERILTRRQKSEVEEMAPDRNYPRKFTVSSLTQQLQHHPPELSNTSSAIMGRHKTVKLHLDDQLKAIRSPISNVSRSKENAPPILKTINVKIEGISRLDSPREGNSESWMESRFVESPPKVSYRRTLHKQPPELVLAVVPSRRHHSPFKPRECQRQWAEGVLGQARLLGYNFVDSMFPPARTIMFSRNVLCQEDHLRFEKLSKIYPSSEVSLLSACEPTLMHVGKYSNPYLYSALTILAEIPTKLLALFGGQHFNQDGAYHVCLCKDGVWRYIVIDDFVPIKAVAGKKQFLCMHNRFGEGVVQLWPALLEKAVAKVYGTYVDLMMSREAGMVDLFKLFTGAPVSSYILNKDFRSFLILIDSALKRGHIVTLQEAREQEQETAQIKNLKIHQAYRVLDIKKSGLKLRNYSQPQLSTKLGFDECLIFKRLVIYRTEPTYRYITHKLRHKFHFFSKLSLNVHNTTRGYFDVWQNNPAYYKRYMGSNILYSPSRYKMWLSRGEEDGMWLQSGKEIELEQGRYELNVHLCQETEYDFTLSYYGQKDIGMERVKCMEQWNDACLCPRK